MILGTEFPDNFVITDQGVFGLTAVTCVVAEIPGHVGSIAPVPTEVLARPKSERLAQFLSGNLK